MAILSSYFCKNIRFLRLSGSKSVKSTKNKKRNRRRKDRSKDHSSNTENRNHNKETDSLSSSHNSEIEDLDGSASPEFDFDDDMDPALMEELDREVEEFARRLNSVWLERVQGIISYGQDRSITTVSRESRRMATQGMHTSKFCLHPAGDTPSACRLFDAIVSLCVPVIISDFIELSFEDVIDYRKIVVFVDTDSAVKPGYVELNLTREGQINRLTQDYYRVKSENSGTRISTTSSNFSVEATPVSSLNSGRASDERGGISQRSPSTNSRLSSCSSEMADDSGSITYAITEGGEIEVPRVKDDVQIPSPQSVLERGMNDELYEQLAQAMAEAENFKRDAFEESLRRRKVEKDAIEAKRRAKSSKSMYAEELRRRQEIEKTLGKSKEEKENIKNLLDDVLEALHLSRQHSSFLESQIADLDHTVQELKQKMFSAVKLLQSYKKERDELQAKCDDALKLVAEMRKKLVEETPSLCVSQLYTEFDFSEVEAATLNFDPFLKIGEGGYGSIFKGSFLHTEVAIKMLNLNSLQGPSEFHQEENVLSKLRHPNVVTLIGSCPEAWIIIYEYLSGGSLEDRLNCKNNTPPLSWQNRVRIASELCSVLSFLHSCGIVHGDLNPDNILLDKNLVTKLSDFGICRVLSQHDFTSNHRIEPKGTFVYMDPEFLSTGELTSKSDTYSFGIILLRLLTGKPALGLTKDIQNALKEKNLKNILDPTAGDWPFVREKFQRLVSEGQYEIPHYFVCPIFQEIMQDPVVAADGFTYEAEALKGWLDSGHNTSPMTNVKLANPNLVPNKALRYAIQEWLQQS